MLTHKKKLVVAFIKRPGLWWKKWLCPNRVRHSQSVQDVGLFLSGSICIIIAISAEYIFSINVGWEVIFLYGAFFLVGRCLFYFKKNKRDFLAEIHFCFDNTQKSIDREKKVRTILKDANFQDIRRVASVTLHRKDPLTVEALWLLIKKVDVQWTDISFRIRELQASKWGGLGIFVESYSYNQEIYRLAKERAELLAQQEELFKKDDIIVEQLGKSQERLEFENLLGCTTYKKKLH